MQRTKGFTSNANGVTSFLMADEIKNKNNAGPWVKCEVYLTYCEVMMNINSLDE